MRIVRLIAPCRVRCAIVNAGEVVGLPDDLAAELVSAGRAQDEPLLSRTEALEEPPMNKLMRPSTRKYFRRGSRHRDATQGD